MLIQDTLDDGDAVRLSAAHATRPARSPARLFAEAVWYLTWHSAAAGSRAIGRYLLCAAIRRERDALADLDDHALRDIGLARADAARESRRAFRDLPAARLQRD